MTGDTVLVYSAIALLTEALVEYFLADWAGKHAKYVALVLGILLAVNFQLDLFNEFLGLESMIPYMGNVATGLVLGRGSNFINDFADQFLRPE